jgi:hypothetical protein
MEENPSIDWNEWSRDAVTAVSSLNAHWQDQYQIVDAKYFWDLDKGTITFTTSERVVAAEICVVGTSSESDETFLWGWANLTLPCALTHKLEAVRQFGVEHDLWLLTTDELSGGSSQGKECLAITARILGSEGAFIDRDGDVTIFFVLSGFKVSPAGAIT